MFWQDGNFDKFTYVHIVSLVGENEKQITDDGVVLKSLLAT